MLSAIAHTALATVAMAGDGDSSHGLPAGEPFGFQVPIAPVVDEQSFALAAWMIWLPVISAVLCGIYAALGVKSRLPAWTTVAALSGSFVIAAMTVS